MWKILHKIFFPSQKLRQISMNLSVFLREHLESNLNLLYYICLLLMVSETILLVTPERDFDYHGVLLFFLIINIITVTIQTIVKKDYSRYSYRWLALLQFTIIANILLLTTNLNFASFNRTDYIHPFIIGLTFLSTALQLSPVSLTVIVFISGSVNLIGMYYYQTDLAVFYTMLINIIVFVITAWVLGILVSRTRVAAWLDHRKVIDQNAILADLTKRDSMTRFFNHESIIMHLKQQIQVSSLTGNPLCVLILDVDDFKKINDEFGHLKGDEVLLMIAKSINCSVRESDIIGRYGGEEFFLIFPNTTLEDAVMVSERVRRSVEEAGIQNNIRVTISGGLALYDGDGADEIIRKSDKRLYTAKRNGKNQIISA